MAARDPIATALPGRLQLVHGEPRRALASGDWTIRRIANAEDDVARIHWPQAGALNLDVSEIRRLDTAGAWLLWRVKRLLEARNVDVEISGLSEEDAVLLRLTDVDSTDHAEPATPTRENPIRRLGLGAANLAKPALRFFSFCGEAIISLLGLGFTPDRMRWAQIAGHVYKAGLLALPITGLLSLLMGVVIAYQGAALLSLYGADIFVVDLVVIAMARELSPLLTAIIVAGRTGSSYTAQIGTMTVTEEVNALRTMGVGPMEYLVLPRLLALIIVLPLLTVFTDLTGILGGMLMAGAQLDLSFNTFIDRMEYALTYKSFTLGLIKTPVFAAIIALVGCYQGFQVRSGAAGVGRHTTMSVVHSLFLVIVADALFSIYFSWLGL